MHVEYYQVDLPRNRKGIVFVHDGEVLAEKTRDLHAHNPRLLSEEEVETLVKGLHPTRVERIKTGGSLAN